MDKLTILSMVYPNHMIEYKNGQFIVLDQNDNQIKIDDKLVAEKQKIINTKTILKELEQLTNNHSKKIVKSTGISSQFEFDMMMAQQSSTTKKTVQSSAKKLGSLYKTTKLKIIKDNAQTFDFDAYLKLLELIK